MFDILSFIDSRDIRDHNRDTQFLPMEQAVLIYHSRTTTVEEKIKAWKELLAVYDSEDDFRNIKYGERKFGECSNRQLVVDTLESYEESLVSRYTKENVIFAANLEEVGFNRPEEQSYFTSYDAAFAYLQEEKRVYLEDEDLKEVPTIAEISMIPLNEKNRRQGTVFLFDNDLRMVDLHPDDIFLHETGLEDAYTYVSTPFCKGDVVKVIGSRTNTEFYGVLPRDNSHYEKEFQDVIGAANRSADMEVLLDVYTEDGFRYGDAMLLHLEKCSYAELPEEQKMLILLSWVYIGEMETGELMHLYSEDGGDAYKRYSKACLEYERR